MFNEFDPENYRGRKVWINYNNETGIWQHSIQIEGTEFWIDSFDTEEKAIIFYHKYGLQIV
jgi:hypothetical protein